MAPTGVRQNILLRYLEQHCTNAYRGKRRRTDVYAPCSCTAQFPELRGVPCGSRNAALLSAALNEFQDVLHGLLRRLRPAAAVRPEQFFGLRFGYSEMPTRVRAFVRLRVQRAVGARQPAVAERERGLS